MQHLKKDETDSRVCLIKILFDVVYLYKMLNIILL